MFSGITNYLFGTAENVEEKLMEESSQDSGKENQCDVVLREEVCEDHDWILVHEGEEGEEEDVRLVYESPKQTVAADEFTDSTHMTKSVSLRHPPHKCQSVQKKSSSSNSKNHLVSQITNQLSVAKVKKASKKAETHKKSIQRGNKSVVLGRSGKCPRRSERMTRFHSGKNIDRKCQ